MLFERSSSPVITPRPDLAWADGAVFNPAAWHEAGMTHLLFRAVPSGYTPIKAPVDDVVRGPRGYDNYVSSIGYATSRDGEHFELLSEPVIRPDQPYDLYGVEDPRISAIDGVHLITYTALDGPAFDPGSSVRIALASTVDFRGFEKHGVIGPDETDKDAVIFPRRIGGRIAMLHRIAPNIQLAWFDDLESLMRPHRTYWPAHMERIEDHTILRPAEPWERLKIGAGPTPIETSEGWLLIYHGVDANFVYRMGLALLDLDDPARVIARARHPVLEPTTDFELHGDIPNVVFPEGAVVVAGRLHVYYGAADRVIGHASASLNDVLALLHEQPLAA
jgi:beta-1,2-mannobiose phosphorylase / 1,2-beta-oligomannan phosphorylase